MGKGLRGGGGQGRRLRVKNFDACGTVRSRPAVCEILKKKGELGW